MILCTTSQNMSSIWASPGCHRKTCRGLPGKLLALFQVRCCNLSRNVLPRIITYNNPLAIKRGNWKSPRKWRYSMIFPHFFTAGHAARAQCILRPQATEAKEENASLPVTRDRGGMGGTTNGEKEWKRHKKVVVEPPTFCFLSVFFSMIQRDQ